jgi:hypothetical protein
MKKLLFIFILLFTFTQIQAQDNDPLLTFPREFYIAKNEITGDSILSKAYFFDQTILYARPDSLNRYLCLLKASKVKRKLKAKFSVIEMSSGKKLWEDEIFENKRDDIDICQDYVMLTMDDLRLGKNIATG